MAIPTSAVAAAQLSFPFRCVVAMVVIVTATGVVVVVKGGRETLEGDASRREGARGG
eukprot:CAMPEP_0206461236 /NCGR_PEP_ID=MMETSP0324_2-20121206/25234_1 /ASSEMBLY_ACC=CAM_ASM_000836 /TAXON_ID=2866 /ORGANISM="Crypthecodinium cohnii, Strain Seligo" /LENGTH=56 /DNA_ID=CAMNT_0053933105 /DNA_START=423 /DNA_END=589 /DNA_ORIENTATION=-